MKCFIFLGFFFILEQISNEELQIFIKIFKIFTYFDSIQFLFIRNGNYKFIDAFYPFPKLFALFHED